MTATAAPFGIRPVYHPSGTIRPRRYTIASAYAVNIFQNDPVALNSSGVLIFATSDGTRTGTATVDILGSFQGVEYIDATGRPVLSNFWPASTVATEIKAYVVDDPLTIFEAQADGSVAQTNVGEELTFGNFATGGSTTTGLSSATLTIASMAATQDIFRIVGFGLGEDNAPGDSFTIVRVQISQSQLTANKAGV